MGKKIWMFFDLFLGDFGYFADSHAVMYELQPIFPNYSHLKLPRKGDLGNYR